MKTLEEELIDFNRYIDEEVKKQSGKRRPSKKDYMKFLEQLQQDLLEQLNATHH